MTTILPEGGDKELSGLYLDLKFPSKNLMALSDITIVDMPGMDSSYQEHDLVANSYLGTSVGYIVCISADEGTIRQSLLSLIKNLSNKNILCGIVVTKADKHETSKISAVKEQVKKEFLRVTGMEPAFVVSVSARKKDIGSLLDALQKLNKKCVEQFKTNELADFYKKIVNYNDALAVKLKAVKNEVVHTRKLIGSIQKNIAELEDEMTTSTDEYVETLVRVFDGLLYEAIKKEEARLIELMLGIYNGRERSNVFKKSINELIDKVLNEITSYLKGAEYNELYNLFVKFAYQVGSRASLPLDINFDLDVACSEEILSKPTSKEQTHSTQVAIARQLIELNIKALRAEQTRGLAENFNGEFCRLVEKLKIKLKGKVFLLEKELKEHSVYLEELEADSIPALLAKRKKLSTTLNLLEKFYGLKKTKKMLISMGFWVFAMLAGLGAYLEYTEEVNINEQEVALPSVVVAQPSKAAVRTNFPYMMPELDFEVSRLVRALRNEQVASYWVEPIQNYLNEPEAYWEDCVYESARFSRAMGGLSEREAYDYGVSSCQDIVSNYYRCLNDRNLPSTVACLKDLISDIEENGD